VIEPVVILDLNRYQSPLPMANTGPVQVQRAFLPITCVPARAGTAAIRSRSAPAHRFVRYNSHMELIAAKIVEKLTGEESVVFE
jgi:hypothetical protein